MAKKNQEPEGQLVPIYTKAQLLQAKNMKIPKDVLMAVLQDEEKYTKEQATELALNFLKGVIK